MTAWVSRHGTREPVDLTNGIEIPDQPPPDAPAAKHLCAALPTHAALRAGETPLLPASDIVASIKRRLYLGAVSVGRHLPVGGRWNRADGPDTLRVLMYHKVTAVHPNRCAVTPFAFLAQQEFLARHYHVVSLEQVRRHVLQQEELPARAVLLTFDDGYRNILEIAHPILERCGHPATIFVPTDFVESVSRLPHDVGLSAPNPTLSWDELRALRGVFTIGSHGCSHRVLTRMPLAEASREIVRSKALLEEHLGTPVHAFSYPKGSIGDFNLHLEDAVRAAGYDIAFTTLPGVNQPGFEPLRIRRHNVEDYGLPYFAGLLGGSAELLALKDTRLGYQARQTMNRLRAARPR